MVKKVKKLTGYQKAKLYFVIFVYLLGMFMGLMILVFFLEYSGNLEEFALNFLERFNI